VTTPDSTGFDAIAAGQLHFDKSGQGPAVVFIHAGIADSRMWNREFELYGKNYTVVRFDLHGLGQTGGATEPYWDIHDIHALLKYLDISSATLVGCSNGGRIALDFVLEYPSMVNALLLLAPALSGWTPALDPEGQSVYDKDAARSAEIPADWEAGSEEEALEELRLYWASAQVGDNLELVRKMMKENAREIFTDASARLNRGLQPPAAGRLGSIIVPTLVLYGDRDEPTIGYIARRVAREIPHARFVPVSGADHLINLSQPAAFDTALRELLPPTT
jgi:pimeloyl-ACP methyl ester carboxylesterase